MKKFWILFLFCLSPTAFCGSAVSDDKADLGSATAKGGFRNEDQIRDKFNDWKNDKDSRAWLTRMGYSADQIQKVVASKPHGYKADVEVVVTTKTNQTTERISIKLVSTSTGFNQIDKRWLKSYAEMWKMPADVVSGLKLYLGETSPNATSRRDNRMYLDELPAVQRDAIVSFFKANKQTIISDLIAGDGKHSANWFMVTQKATDTPRWVLRPTKDVVVFFSEGPVEMTRAGNLKLGRISMQRKGGDNGRETAKMLQFKMNPAMLFNEQE